MTFSRLVLGLLLSFSTLANAAFVVTNGPSSGNGFVDVDSSTSFTLYSSNNSASFSGLVSLTYTDTASIDSLISFDWKYFTQDIGGSTLDPAGFILNGFKTQLSVNDLPQFSVYPLVGVGSYSINVSAGDVFGFYVDAADNQFGRGQLNINNFMITPIPEPEAYAMFIAGLGLICFTSRRKNS